MSGRLEKMQGKDAELVQRVAKVLDLGVAAAAWHLQHDEWVALGCELGLLCGSLGKIGKDIALMSQFEVAELAAAQRAPLACWRHRDGHLWRTIAGT